jgi:hypothetical protein
MKHLSRQLICHLLLIISASLMMAAQTYHITPVVTPTTSIDGQGMAGCHQPDSVAISPSGEIAFTTYCSTGERQLPNFVMTSKRIVAKDGYVIDGRHITLSSPQPIAINSNGQVAYTVLWVDDGKDPKDDANWHEGICIDRHFVQSIPNNLIVRSLTLTDDGVVSFNQPIPTAVVPPAPAPARQASLLHQIPLKLPPLKMPKNLPIGIPATPQTAPLAPPSGKHMSVTADPLPLLTTNRRGQAVIVANLPDWRFVILLATPAN